MPPVLRSSCEDEVHLGHRSSLVDVLLVRILDSAGSRLRKVSGRSQAGRDHGPGDLGRCVQAAQEAEEVVTSRPAARSALGHVPAVIGFAEAEHGQLLVPGIFRGLIEDAVERCRFPDQGPDRSPARLLAHAPGALG
jgi:hypothetical protein